MLKRKLYKISLSAALMYGSEYWKVHRKVEQ